MAKSSTAPPPRPDVLAFLQKIKEDPDDDTPRLVLSDWLEEHGDTARAEFIRVQCERAKLTKKNPRCGQLHRRARLLRRRHENHWLEPLREHTLVHDFVRGLVAIEINNRKAFDKQALRRLTATEACAWVYSLRVPDDRTYQDFVRFAALLLVHLNELACHIDDKDAVILAASPNACHLRHVELADSFITSRGMKRLAASPHLANLTSLDLSHTLIGPTGAEALAASSHLTKLTRLDLSETTIGDPGVCALANAPNLTKLKELSLFIFQADNVETFKDDENDVRPFGDKGARALVASQYLNQLVYLDLRGNRISRQTQVALRDRFGKAARL